MACTTHDFWNTAGESTDAQCDTLAATFVTFWDAIRSPAASAIIGASVELTELRFYKGYDGDGTPGEVDYVKTYTGKPGTGAFTLPPQVSCSVTEMTDSRRHWGRFYIPGISNALTASDGTLSVAGVTKIVDAAEAMYESWGALSGHTPIVWGRKRASVSYLAMAPPRWRPTWMSPGGTTAEIGEPIALAVQSVRVDEILDIQRRRRWESTLGRQTRVLA